ncbi:MAG TPA: hypothetical protein V6C98_00505, partial [Thermosynechococcaceae cyanobacterium]
MRNVTLSLSLLSSLLGFVAPIAPAHTLEPASPELTISDAASRDSASPDLADHATSAQDDETPSPGKLLAQTSPSPEPAPIAPVVRILAPQATTTGERSTNLIVQYPAATTVQVTVNQTPINPAIQTQTQAGADGVTQVWYDIP